MDDWRVDLAVAGSQKGLMLPAGLGILGISPRAIAASKTATMRRAYFDFSDQLKMNATGYFPYTPPTQLLHGLRRARILCEEETARPFRTARVELVDDVYPADFARQGSQARKRLLDHFRKRFSSVAEGDARLARVAAKIRGWQATPGMGAGTTP